MFFKKVKGTMKMTGQYHQYSLADFRQLQEDRTSEAGYFLRKALIGVAHIFLWNIIPLLQSLQYFRRFRSHLGVSCN